MDKIKELEINKLLALLLVTIVMTSCNKYEVLETYSDGSIKLKCQMDGGDRNGECIQYYPNDQIEFVANYESNILNGKSIFYHSNGQLNWEVSFNHGIKSGEIEYYDSLGRLYQVSNFYNNELHGETYSFYANQNLESTMNYSMGQLDGEFRSFYDNGNIKSKSIFENGINKYYIIYDSTGVEIEHGIKYALNYKPEQDSLEVIITINEATNDAYGFRLLNFDETKQEITHIVKEIYSNNDTLSFKLLYPKRKDKVIVKGILFGVNQVDDENGVIESKIQIDREIQLPG